MCPSFVITIHMEMFFVSIKQVRDHDNKTINLRPVHKFRKLQKSHKKVSNIYAQENIYEEKKFAFFYCHEEINYLIRYTSGFKTRQPFFLDSLKIRSKLYQNFREPTVLAYFVTLNSHGIWKLLKDTAIYAVFLKSNH